MESNFRHLKMTTGMAQSKCQTPVGVMKELVIFAMVYKLVRAAMMRAWSVKGSPMPTA